jgi:hypothetical protein
MLGGERIIHEVCIIQNCEVVCMLLCVYWCVHDEGCECVCIACVIVHVYRG